MKYRESDGFRKTTSVVGPELLVERAVAGTTRTWRHYDCVSSTLSRQTSRNERIYCPRDIDHVLIFPSNTCTAARNELNGPLPSWELSKLSKLQQLDLSDNLLTGPLESSLLGPSLTKLDLDKNFITGSMPQEWFTSAMDFYALDGLTRLSLSNNFLTGIIPDRPPRQRWEWKWRESTLEQFLVGDNVLTGTMPSWIFNHTANLRHLLLSGNAVRRLPEQDLSACHSVRVCQYAN